jgi:hypothetical protein
MDTFIWGIYHESTDYNSAMSEPYNVPEMRNVTLFDT